MTYNIGDRVRIKSIDWYNENKDRRGLVSCGCQLFTEQMSAFCGCVMTIWHKTEGGSFCFRDNKYYWTEEMFECIVDESQEESQEIMTKEEIIQFLKDNLTIQVDSNEDEGYLETIVTLYLGDKEITSSSASANIRVRY